MSREHYHQLQAQLKELDQKTNKLNEERHQLHLLLNEEVRKIIASEKLLTETKWKLEHHQKLIAEKNSDQLPRLADLAETNYHCSLNLTKEVSLFFDDREVSLFCKSPGTLRQFIKDYSLEIDSSLLDQEIKELRQKLTELESWTK